MYIFVTTASMLTKWKSVYLKLLEQPPLFIPQADSYWPSTWPSLMREFLNIRGCLTHILVLNQPSGSHLYRQGPTAVTYSRERWHILLLPTSPGRSTWLVHTGTRRLANCRLLMKCPPVTSNRLRLAAAKHFFSYETMPFWPSCDFLSRSTLYEPLWGSLCHNQCSHGWEWPPGMRRLTASRLGPGIKGLSRVKRLVRGKK